VLILTEGDSAKSLAVAGLSVLGRDKYGVYPLKGKLLNVRDATHNQLLENNELNEIKTILGLSHERTYEPGETGEGNDYRDGLRYGKVMLMTDQDHDGMNIIYIVPSDIISSLFPPNKKRFAHQGVIYKSRSHLLASSVEAGLRGGIYHPDHKGD